MSVDSDNDSDVSNHLFDVEPDEIPSTIPGKLGDDEQFLFDEELSKLICIGVQFDDIPLNILHDYSLKTKVTLEKKRNSQSNMYIFRFLI